MESLDTRSGKQRVAARGEAISATGTVRPPMAVASANAPCMCVPYTFRSSLPSPIEDPGRPVMCRVSDTGPLLTRAVAIGDCHGQELNRGNLHDPALSLAQVEPRPRGVAVARRQTKGLENGIPDWKSVSLVRRARKYPRAPHAGLPRRRSHASRHRPHANGISLPEHVGPGKRARCGRRRSSETPDRTP